MEEKFIKYMKAQQKAEKEKKEEFECPLCGGAAWWVRAKINNHLHTGCKKCGFRIMQ